MSGGLSTGDRSLLETRLVSNLQSFRERMSGEREQRRNLARRVLSFGVAFLDDALGGIYQNDLILVGAKTGIGKTQLATIIAMSNAGQGKRVHFFALEAEPQEIERRIKYQLLAHCFFKTLRREFSHVNLNYLDWYYGRLDTALGKVEQEVEDMLKDLYPTLWTFYRKPVGQFTVKDLEREVFAIAGETDLICVDHAHYLDSDDENEARGLKDTTKRIRDLALLTGKPIVLVAHMRKSDRRAKLIAPGCDEFHGSSDLPKIATKAITLAPCNDMAIQGNRWPTYCRIAKCRVDGSRTRYVGLLSFNADTNAYDPGYFLGRLTSSEDEFEAIKAQEDLPYWATGARLSS